MPGVLLALAAASLSDSSFAGPPATPAPKKVASADRAAEEFFEARVRPVLVEHCLDCHGTDKKKGGLRLDGRAAMLKGGDTGPAVVPGKPDESALITAVRYDAELQMPPKGKLKDTEIAALNDWVKRGAQWPEPRQGVSATKPVPAPAALSVASTISTEDRAFWSFQAVRNPTPPAVHDATWTANPLDRFILASLEGAGISPSPPADKRTLIRRASFDLTGLPPTAEEIDAFLRDAAPDAFARVVDRLLASPRYGERWARHWLDIARYGEDQAHSFQPRLYPSGYRYRDWLIRSFNRDLPYDQFVIAQIAGDLLDGPEAERNDRLAAVGMFACGPVYYGDEKKHDQYADRIDTLTRGFLGLTVACARCHDHKYDPIPTADYYSLEAIFASTDYSEIPAVPRSQVEAYDKAQEAIKAKDKQITEFVKSEVARLKIKSADEKPRLLERLLPEQSKTKIQAMRAELETIKKSAPPKYPVIHSLVDRAQPVDGRVLVRGNPDTPSATVPRQFLAVLTNHRTAFRQGSGRLELARAVASPENPLTARVMVNRVWQQHFGRGLVATSSNFGTLGERPSHPELLDWLAHRFVASGWSLKELHRTIMLSSAYQQSSRFDSQSAERDPANTLVWRMNRRRLDVEAWRDAILTVAGRLETPMGGPSVSVDSASNHRRTVYAAVSRHDLAWMLRLFDFPDPNITSGSRTETTVPLQQLFVLNSEFMIDAARAVAARISPAAPSPNEPRSAYEYRVNAAYSLLYGRPATIREMAIGVSYLTADDPAPAAASSSRVSQPDLSRWERYTQALLAANEFVFVD
jgi:mono/diheme cytochrome c family protein